MNLSPRQQAFFLIAIKQRLKSADSLFRFLPKNEREEMSRMYQELSEHKESSLKKVVGTELPLLARTKTFSFLSDVHDDWISEILMHESPEMIAMVFRYLPAERVKTILQSFSQEILNRMPKLSNVYALPTDLVELLKAKFESFFPLHRNHTQGQKFEMEHFCMLSSKQIHEVFSELGYHEIAIGMVSLPEQARQIVMERLSNRDRLKVQDAIKHAGDLSPQRIKRAQMHLVSKDLGMSTAVPFILELGYLVYAKSLLPRDQEDMEIVMKKISRAGAHCLEKFAKVLLSKNSEASIMAYREDILGIVQKVLVL